MNKWMALPFLMLGLTACQSHRDVVMQVSTQQALESGAYDGRSSLADLKLYGDMGIGMLHRLDGEFILVNGDFYRIRYNGKVDIPPSGVTTPFSVVTRFEPTIDRRIDRSMTLEQLQGLLDELIPDPSTYCVFYLRGNFRRVKTRSLPAQSKPYRTFHQVSERQSTFEFLNEHGTLVGVRVPRHMSGIDTPGYHFHFLNEPRDGGGRVLDATMTRLHIRADTRHNSFHMIKP